LLGDVCAELLGQIDGKNIEISLKQQFKLLLKRFFSISVELLGLGLCNDNGVKYLAIQRNNEQVAPLDKEEADLAVDGFLVSDESEVRV
jgi:hypothetical protein